VLVKATLFAQLDDRVPGDAEHAPEVLADIDVATI
jgi:hypothetical protein